ncbi:MFS transporter [Salirhabdus salicampi]|uniref:MFS transporter n=1 Tax=Salirhabdus salicampi TaxID=476102 RepID=UPI0020C1FCA4|nr:MFS transporter [Salirhabdus salicampi]MCP8618097.1 MFS transporter [Salirhabdus salicampi]
MAQQGVAATEAPMKTPFYYGWVVVVVSALGLFFSGPGQTYSVSIFIDYYIQDFEFSRSFVSGLYSIATLGAGFLLAFVGRLADRFGQRATMGIIGTLLAITCFWNSLLTGPIMMFIGFFFLRLLGQGSMTLLPNTLVPQWFMEKRGRALSVMAVGGFISAAIYPPVNTFMIGFIGWRLTWIFWGLLILLIFVPATLYFVRNRPEQVNEVIDGHPRDRYRLNRSQVKGMIAAIFIVVNSLAFVYFFSNWYVWFPVSAVLFLFLYRLLLRRLEKQESHRRLNLHGEVNEVSWTLNEAMKTRAFWIILFCVSVPSLVNTGITFHIVSIAEGKGLTPGTAATMLALMAIIGFPISFISGYLVDKFKVHYILAVTFFIHIVAILVLWQLNSVVGAFIYGGIWGIAHGFERVVLSIIWPNYFGREHLGSIKGVSQSVMVFASALGPLPFALFYDWFSRYDEVLLLTTLLPLTAGLLVLISPKPKHTSIE